MSKGFPMYNVIRVVHFAEATDASDRAEYIETVRIAVKELGALRQLVAPTLPGVINGGDALVHLHFPSAEDAARHTAELDAALRGPITVRVDGVGYPACPAQARVDEPRTLYRALLIRVDPSAAGDAVERFERDLLKMPDYISSIVAWRLSRVATPSVAPSGHTSGNRSSPTRSTHGPVPEPSRPLERRRPLVRPGMP